MDRRVSLLRNLIPIIPVAVICIPAVILRRRLSAVLIPLAAAAVLAYMLGPAVDHMAKKHRRITRDTACAVVFSVFLLILAAVLAFLVPAVAGSAADIIENKDVIEEKFTDCICGLIPERYSSFREKASSIAASFCELADSKLSGAVSARAALSSCGRISDIAVGGVTSLVITYYFLKDKTAILNGIYGLFPYRWRSGLSAAADELGMISAKFIQGQLLVAAVIGVTEAAGLALIGVPYALLLGVIGGLSNTVPYFGPFIGAAAPVLTALTVSPSKALWTAALFIAVQQFDNRFLSPKIIEGNLGIHPVTVIIIVFIGEEFFGLAGIIAAVPVYAMVKCIIRRLLKAFRFPDPL